MEPTGPAWLPIAVFFTARGHVVHRVSLGQGGGPAPVPVPAHQDQRHRRRHAGPAAAVRPGRPAAAASCPASSARRWTGGCGPPTGSPRPAPSTSVRIKDLVRQLLPMTPLTGELGVADLAVLERCADPNALVKLGVEAAHGADRQGVQGPPGRRTGRRVDRRRRGVARRSTPATRPSRSPTWPPRSPPRSACCAPSRPSSPPTPPNARPATAGSTPPGWPARLPGVADIGGPALVAAMGDPARFAPRQAVPVLHRARPQGLRDRRHRPQGPTHVQGRVVAAAHHPGPRRRQRPQARPPTRPHLLPADGRARQGPPRRPLRRRRQPRRTVLGRDDTGSMPYVICDTDGRPVTPDEAKAIIAEHWTVPADVRARRRSKKVGKAPQQVLAGTGEATRSRRRQTRRPSPPRIVHGHQRPRQPTNRLTTDPP